MEGDRVFHYQLTIQKLREELALYRNGTDGQELLELLGEKDAEVERLRASLSEKDEKLKKLAKKGAEVIARCDALQAEASDLRARFVSVEAEKEQFAAAVAELQATATSATALCQEKSATIDFLETELAVRSDSVDKLHARCADLLSDKAEAVKELAKIRQEQSNDRASKSKHGKELMEELERAMRFNTEVKERLNREHAQNLELMTRLQATERDLQALTKAKAEAEATLERRERDAEAWRRDVAAAEAELGDVRLQLAVATSQAGRTERQEDELKRVLAEKDRDVARLQQRLAEAEDALHVSSAQAAADADTRLAEEQNARRSDAARFETDAHAARGRLLQAEAELRELQEALAKEREYRQAKQQLVSASAKEMLALQAKNQELEDKIRRQEQYMKSRLLKDRSNMQSASSVNAAAYKLKENGMNFVAAFPAHAPTSSSATAATIAAENLVSPTSGASPSFVYRPPSARAKALAAGALGGPSAQPASFAPGGALPVPPHALTQPR